MWTRIRVPRPLTSNVINTKRQMNLNKYLETFFPNLKLQKPLFYNWQNGLRFEVGSELIPTMKDSEKDIINLEYFDKALDRAIELFQFSFDSDDEIIIVYQRYSKNRQKIKKNNFYLRAIDNIKSKKVENCKLRNLYSTDSYETNKEHWHRLAVHSKANEINYKRMLNRLIYLDFGFAGPEVYFINKTKNIIFHLYDDRGLDIIASDKKDLESIYQKFNHWILDYDRKQIDALFK